MSRHLAQIRKRHKLAKDAEVPFELLADLCCVDLADIKKIYEKAKTKALHAPAAEKELDEALKALSEKVGLVATKVEAKVEAKEKPKKKITATGTVKKGAKKTSAKKADATDKAPEESPKLVRQDAVDPHTVALHKVYEWLNRLERFKAGEIKNPPPPKKITSKYIDKPSS